MRAIRTAPKNSSSCKIPRKAAMDISATLSGAQHSSVSNPHGPVAICLYVVPRVQITVRASPNSTDISRYKICTRCVYGHGVVGSCNIIKSTEQFPDHRTMLCSSEGAVSFREYYTKATYPSSTLCYTHVCMHVYSKKVAKSRNVEGGYRFHADLRKN